jgi:hypothetical protein
MSDRLSKLLKSFESHISIPWNTSLSAEERSIFVVYDKMDELKLRARVGEFEHASELAGHKWFVLDVTDAFPIWMSSQKRVTPYFKRPELMRTKFEYFFDDLVELLASNIPESHGENDVISVLGCATLFGFVSVSNLVKALSPHVKGRLVVFFPGEKKENTFSLLDATDGWGYQATAITNN